MAITQTFEATGISDLLAQIRFDSEHGKIWLNEQRMLMIHSSGMGLLRKELIETLGIHRAKGFLMRFGYHAGWKDAELVAKVRPNMSKEAAFFVGPQLHGIKGMVVAKPVTLQLDVDAGTFNGEFDWFDSYEADVHLHDFGPADEPICWTLIGYASGYTSFFMGRNIIFKETACAGMGADHCHIVGKPAEEWEDQEELERYLLPDRIADELFSLQSQLSELRDNFRNSDQSEDLLFNSVGQSGAFKNVCQMIRRASTSKVTVLLQGETGVGKEVVARGLHQSSDRADKPFVAVNCACIPPDLIEAELFGVEKGAFTGATQSREGKFERANGGTIFLDEVVELSPRAQASLLRVLQESEMERVGDTRTRRIDVRVVAAANEDLEQAVSDGKFRADLFYRLNVYPVHIPPLRERTEDIPLLVSHFLEKYHTLYNKRTQGVSDMAMQALMHYKWPGNIRELENMIERGVILTDNNHTIDLDAFFPSLSEPTHPLNSINRQGVLAQQIASNSAETGLSQSELCEQLLNDEFSLEQMEEQLIRRAMDRSDGNVSQAARLLGMTRPQLAYRLKKLELA
ncbi:sigma-54-dependent Fis family transcriptional regulator [Marinobacterium sediminicola]|uniref:Regulatory protein, Fis family n=1 Tax=Marinobacterium sediminicola TaxID=518898 RepID=A0ABY1S145_9GAMM|nr:sigma-54-dependent Fis family transcriptional regulator [Marinobacterium sediminicola]ULG68351.1 sigma 54-interacting transcriptional regulator [Marinobacterium sediminicola]SMR74770.1 regulatory protein, Fis family [Marinobacterium sediminicola]